LCSLPQKTVLLSHGYALATDLR